MWRFDFKFCLHILFRYSYDDEHDWKSLRENHANLLSHATFNAGFRNTRKNSPQGRRRRSGRKERKREAGGETDGVRSMEAKGDEQGCYCVVVWLNVLIPITTICPGSALLRALWPGHRRKMRLRLELVSIVWVNDKSISYRLSRFRDLSTIVNIGLFDYCTKLYIT